MVLKSLSPFVFFALSLLRVSHASPACSTLGPSGVSIACPTGCPNHQPTKTATSVVHSTTTYIIPCSPLQTITITVPASTPPAVHTSYSVTLPPISHTLPPVFSSTDISADITIPVPPSSSPYPSHSEWSISDPYPTYTLTDPLTSLSPTPFTTVVGPVGKRAEATAGCTVTVPCKDCTKYPVTTTETITQVTTLSIHAPCPVVVTTVTA